MKMVIRITAGLILILAMILVGCAPTATQLPTEPPEVDNELPAPPKVDKISANRRGTFPSL